MMHGPMNVRYRESLDSFELRVLFRPLLRCQPQVSRKCRYSTFDLIVQNKLLLNFGRFGFEEFIFSRYCNKHFGGIS